MEKGGGEGTDGMGGGPVGGDPMQALAGCCCAACHRPRAANAEHPAHPSLPTSVHPPLRSHGSLWGTAGRQAGGSGQVGAG